MPRHDSPRIRRARLPKVRKERIIVTAVRGACSVADGRRSIAGFGVCLAVEWVLLGSDAMPVGVAVCVTVDGPRSIIARSSGKPVIMRGREAVPVLRDGTGATCVGQIARCCAVLAIFGTLGQRKVAGRRMRKVLVH